ncbi:MAG: anhydro-N-acetylmuramic acid kinase, partial [Halieaceae bacterium]
ALLATANRQPEEIRAIGSHGQTIRHRPASAGHSPASAFTLQIGDPNSIAELTGITTVADFRRRDVAAGGEGAPLAPAFHAAAFSTPTEPRAIVNIGGIANATLLQGEELLAGFDTGPGNTLLDQWIQQHQGQSYDRDGNWSSEGEIIPALREQLLSDPYFDRTGPRSTGKEYFNLQWLERALTPLPEQPSNRDVQATLADVTAQSIADGITSTGFAPAAVYICGGGACNTDLMRRLYQKLAPARLETTEVLGIEPEWVEAAAFAWLAHQAVTGKPGNAPAVTGAEGPRVLGGIYPA